MTSSDVQIFKSGLEDLKFYIDTRISDVNKQLTEIRTEIRTVNENVLVNSAKIEAQRDFISIGFTIMAVVIALIGFVVTLAPMFREIYRDAKIARKHDNNLTAEKVQLMIDDSIAKALNNFLVLSERKEHDVS